MNHEANSDANPETPISANPRFMPFLDRGQLPASARTTDMPETGLDAIDGRDNFKQNTLARRM
jgi:hypothetical protein